MSQQPSRADIYAALTRKSGFQVVQENETPRQLRIMGRSHVDRWPFFLPVIYTLLLQSSKAEIPWTCDISKQYIINKDRVLYAWRMIFQSENLSSYYGDIAAAITSSPSPSRVEITEQLLPGYKRGDVRGGVNAKGKGSSSAGSIPLAMANRGGVTK